MKTYTIPTVRFRVVRDGRPFRCTDDQAAADVIRHVCCEDPTVERMTVLFLDGRSQVRGQHVVSQGGAHGCVVRAREIYSAALRAGASAIILGHNHPSGDPTPSGADDSMTGAVRAAGEMIGIPLVDHVIVTECGRSYSYLDHGRLDGPL
jgi:DNA repair protein RadC